MPVKIADRKFELVKRDVRFATKLVSRRTVWRQGDGFGLILDRALIFTEVIIGHPATSHGTRKAWINP